LQLNHQINALPILAMLLKESSPPQSLAQLDLHVPPPIAILPEDVSMMQLSANLLDALTTNATQLPTNVKLLFQAVMMVMHVLLIASTQPLAALTLLFALLLICARL
jgi:hypothetical protein